MRGEPHGDEHLAGDPDQCHLDAIADADLFPYWFDDVDEPDSNQTLVRTGSCDRCVVGGWYTGLVTAIIAKSQFVYAVGHAGTQV